MSTQLLIEIKLQSELRLYICNGIDLIHHFSIEILKFVNKIFFFIV